MKEYHNMKVIGIVLGIVFLSVIFTNESFGEMEPEISEWYLGKNLETKQYYRYNVCDRVNKDCSDFTIEFWIKRNDFEKRQFVVQALVNDNGNRVRGEFTIDKDKGTIINSKISIGDYGRALNESMFWLYSTAHKDFPQQLYDGNVWNKDLEKAYQLEVKSNSTIIGNIESEYVLENPKEDPTRDKMVWINSEIPFPIKGIFHIQKGHAEYSDTDSKKNKIFEFELEEYQRLIVPEFLFYDKTLEKEELLYDSDSRAIKLIENIKQEQILPRPIKTPTVGVWGWYQNLQNPVLKVVTIEEEFELKLRTGNKINWVFEAPITIERITLSVDKADAFGYIEIGYYRNFTNEELEQRKENSRPEAYAGRDIIVPIGGAIVTLDGTNSTDKEGDRLVYSWEQTYGSPVRLSSKVLPQVSFDTSSLTKPETLEFELSVTDPFDNRPVKDRVEVKIHYPPLKQFKNNIDPNQVICEKKLVLIIKISDITPACVSTSTIEKLVERGWGIPKNE